MKLTNAIKKLEKAGFTLITNGSIYIASKEDVDVSFVSFGETVKSNGFTYESKTSSAPTFGMTLRSAIS